MPSAPTANVGRARDGARLPAPTPPPPPGVSLPVGWPLLWALGGYGLVWLLGARLIVWPVVAVLLLGWLAVHRTGRWSAPAGFGVWLFFLGWTLVSALTIDSVERLVAWGYRESLYVTATIVLVFCVSAGERSLPTRRIAQAVVSLFATTVVLGTIGILLPEVTIPTLTEQVLPGAVMNTQFIQEQVIARLGGTAPFLDAVRPVAPYGYTNEWGAALGMLWPLALWGVGWMRTRAQRATVWGLIVFTAVPAVVSVNRGLWVSMVLALLVVLVRAGVAGHVRLVGGVLFLGLCAAVATWFTPLREVLLGRLDNPNLGTRETLAGDAVGLVGQSPLFGYGAPQEAALATGTNDVSVGTHGQLFTLLVSHGIPGALLYLGFFVVVLVVTVKVSGRAVWAWSAIVVLLVQSPFYNAVPVPLVLGCVAVAVCLRSLAAPTPVAVPPSPRRLDPGPASGGPMPAYPLDAPDRTGAGVDHRTVDVGRYGRGLARRLPLVLVAMLAGAVLGYFFLATTSYAATSTIEVEDGYVSMMTETSTEAANLATEQQVASSSLVLDRAAEGAGGGLTADDYRAHGEVTTPTDSTTLSFSYTSSSAAQAQEAVAAWSGAYLAQREDILSSRLDDALSQARAQIEVMQRRLREVQADAPPDGSGTSSVAESAARTQLDAARLALSNLSTIDVDAGRQLGDEAEPAAAVGLTAPLGAALGGAAGLVLGALLALLAVRADRRVRGPRDVSSLVAPDVWVDVARDDDRRALGAVAARLAMLASRGEAHTVLLASLSTEADDLAQRLAAEMRESGHEVTVQPASSAVGREATERDGDARRRGVRLLSGGVLVLDPRTAVAAGGADLTVLVVDRSVDDLRDVRGAVLDVERNRGVVGGVLLRGRGPRWGSRLARRRRHRRWARSARRAQHRSKPTDERAAGQPDRDEARERA